MLNSNTIIIQNNMKTIDIAEILSPDLKSRMRARDLKDYVDNSQDSEIKLDFQKVNFATRSFIDEFYNLFLKDPSSLSYSLEIINVPEDINIMLETVSRTQVRTNVIPSKSEEISFDDVDELIKYLSTCGI